MCEPEIILFELSLDSAMKWWGEPVYMIYIFVKTVGRWMDEGIGL